MQNIWSVVDLLHWDPHWLFPVVSYAYSVNIDRKMLDKFLYVVDTSDMPWKLLHSALSLFLYVGTMIDSSTVQPVLFLFHIYLTSL